MFSTHYDMNLEEILLEYLENPTFVNTAPSAIYSVFDAKYPKESLVNALLNLERQGYIRFLLENDFTVLTRKALAND